MSTQKSGKNGSIHLSFQPDKGYRKDVGTQRDPATGRRSYKRFWLGHDDVKARELVRLIVAEWKLIRAHRGEVWTAEALARIERAKKGQADPLTSGALAPVPPPVLAPAVLAPPAPEPAPSTSAQAAPASTAPPSTRPPAGTSLYDAIAAYDASFKQEAASGQISEGRWVNAIYAMERLKYAMPDRPLGTIGFDEIRAVVGYFTSPPVSKSNKRKLAPDTVFDTLNFIRALFSHLSDTGQWAPLAPINKLFRYSREKVYTDAELEQRQVVKVFTLNELRFIWRTCGNDYWQLLFLLGLNCGFTQKEVATLSVRHCRLDGPRPTVRRHRFKTKVPGQWRLWPETAALLKKWIATHGSTDLVFTRRNTGKPLVYFNGRHRYDAVHSEWRKIRKRADERYRFLSEMYDGVPPHQLPPGHRAPVKVRWLGYKHLRKTGSDLIRQIAGKDTAEVYLAHTDSTLSRFYNNRDFKKLSKALRKMREQLVDALGPLPMAASEPPQQKPPDGSSPRAA